jgi:hypothetical protein
MPRRAASSTEQAGCGREGVNIEEVIKETIDNAHAWEYMHDKKEPGCESAVVFGMCARLLETLAARIAILESALRVIAGQKCWCDAETIAQKALESK